MRKERQTDFERGPARKASYSFGISETKSLIEFRIDPELCVFPLFDADKTHEIKAFTPLVGREALQPRYRVTERRRIVL